MTDLLGPVTRTSLYDEVARRLRHMVVDGELAPGQRLNERLLCEQLAVSRTPLREAYRLLAAEGLLELLPNRGAVVAPLSVAELDATIEVLAALEELVGQLAAVRATDAAIDQIAARHHEMVAHQLRRDLPGYFAANQDIHFALVAATGNAVLAEQYRVLNARIRRYRYIANLSAERWQQSVAEHTALLDLLRRRDGVGLGAALHQHLANKLVAVKARLTATA